LIKYIGEAEKYVEITGFRKVTLSNKEEFLNAVRPCRKELALQFFNADLICTWEHLYFAALNALTAFQTRTNISKSVDMEMLLYASSQNQIRKAIALVGIKSNSTNIAITTIGPNSHFTEETVSRVSSLVKCEPDDSVLELTQEKITSIKRVFQITETEIESVMTNNDLNQALVDLVIERMALLPTQI
jgi:KEOPS complex subunit Cgi121